MYGATPGGKTTEFRLWAPNAKSVTLQIQGKGPFPMLPAGSGYFAAEVSARAGDRYSFQLDGDKGLPDPVSRLLPEGVHGPTEIVDPNAFPWTDKNWRGLPFAEYIIYELHVGTFSPSGTFDGVRERLGYLKDLGITAIEIMPVAAFPGTRNWGYDGVSIYAVQASYGGPDGLKRLVDAAHDVGLAVILDVVYNHLGNEGNYLGCFGPYFTSRHKTPWGDAINYDDEHSEHVRRYVVENALYWVREYHIDGLRLDAIQTIRDDSPKHIVAEIQQAVQDLAQRSGRIICLVAESDQNDSKLVRPPNTGGYGLHGFWSDDFHHSVHAFLTGERSAYYQDFGKPEQIVRALNEGYVFQGDFFRFWGEPRGTLANDVPLNANVISIQNHDQVGNRAQGERLGHLVSNGALKAAATLMLLAPHTPMIFMGEEYGETSPFQFFTDYGDPALQEAVAEGRRKEFEEFNWAEVPDPQDPATFEWSKLDWELATENNDLLRWYRALLRIRKEYIVTGERTVRAQLLNDAVQLSLPATEPKLLIFISLKPGSVDPKIHPGTLLRSDDDGYLVSISLAGASQPELMTRSVFEHSRQA